MVMRIPIAPLASRIRGADAKIGSAILTEFFRNKMREHKFSVYDPFVSIDELPKLISLEIAIIQNIRGKTFFIQSRDRDPAVHS